MPGFGTRLQEATILRGEESATRNLITSNFPVHLRHFVLITGFTGTWTKRFLYVDVFIALYSDLSNRFELECSIENTVENG